MPVATLPRREKRMPASIKDTSGQDTPLDPAPRRRRRLIVALAAAAVLVAAALLTWPAWRAYSEAEVAVAGERLRLARVERGPFVRDVSVSGTVVAAVSPTLYAPAPGTVTFTVQAGERVARDEPLATLDSPELTNELERERATLQSLQIDLDRQGIETKKQQFANQQIIDLAQVEIEAADRELRRAEASFEHQVISERDYEEARDDLSTARLRFEHAKQNAALEKETLEFELKTTALLRDRQRLLVANLERKVDALAVKSPVDGLVGNLAVAQKANVQINQPLLTVVDLSAFEIEIRVPESYGDDLAIGQEAEVSYGRDTYPATVTAISPEIQNNQVTGRIRFAGEVPDGLRQNQRVSARVILEAKDDALKLARGAFLDSGGGRVAYVLADGMATRRDIAIGAVSVGEVEILRGLEAGDTVIVSDTTAFEGAARVLVNE
ncbi:MAG TPA: HlyD family efflux transporter periplasmic adaptor subunit [Gammaproteobacteria bacterium]|nr:HlyD family efflux transporter periplasmic adaptor subunit [Gammaproteobacteria bacterium]